MPVVQKDWVLNHDGRGLLWWEFLVIERDINPPLLVVPAGPEVDQGSCDECRNPVEICDIVETRETWVRQILVGHESEDYGVADAGQSEDDLGGTLLLLKGVLRSRQTDEDEVYHRRYDRAEDAGYVFEEVGRDPYQSQRDHEVNQVCDDWGAEPRAYVGELRRKESVHRLGQEVPGEYDDGVGHRAYLHGYPPEPDNPADDTSSRYAHREGEEIESEARVSLAGEDCVDERHPGHSVQDREGSREEEKDSESRNRHVPFQRPRTLDLRSDGRGRVQPRIDEGEDNGHDEYHVVEIEVERKPRRAVGSGERLIRRVAAGELDGLGEAIDVVRHPALPGR